MRKIFWDIIFIVCLGILMLFLNNINAENILMKYPFITSLVTYFIGRLVSISKKKDIFK